VDIDVDEFLDDIPSGARVATSDALASKTNTLGVLDAGDKTLASVSGDQSEALCCISIPVPRAPVVSSPT
jgi:hypothetical protein